MQFGKQIIRTLAIPWIGIALLAVACKMPSPEKKKNELHVKHNYIILLDLSDRLIMQNDQPARDTQIIKDLYSIFEEKVKKELYIKSRDEIRVVIAPQLGTDLNNDVFEDRLYVNMGNVNHVLRKSMEDDRRKDFFSNLDTLYNRAVFSQRSEDYYGADIWKYFYEDLKTDYSNDTLTQNFLFILTDGYPIVGQQSKLLKVKNEFPNLEVVLVEAAPRERDLEWDHIMSIWEDWFNTIGIRKYTLIKRGSITKELEQIKSVIQESNTVDVTASRVIRAKKEAIPSVDKATLAELYKNEKRYALVIGNSKYKNVAALRNPFNDATDMATLLKEMNFDVISVTDATYIEIRSAFQKFHEKLVNGPKDETVGLVYYSGHGLQYDGENYFVPVDAKIEYEDDVPRQCFPVQKIILKDMERSNSRMNILILDACRNNSFPQSTRSLQNGLAEMKVGKGSFIAYATAPGSTASDGVGRNGLYTQELIKAIRKPYLPIESVFKEVRINVLRLSGENQYTWDYSNITGDFYFNLNPVALNQ
ncbi:MAG TPA: caspase family protein [Cyclobacteriaceae bacterium]|jgi:hypothetical protein|nr:caspase family protein [Cyclobacteriaceae bacterium]